MTPLKDIVTPLIKTGFKLIWVLLLSSCLTPVEFSTDNIGGTLVVTGQVSTLQDQNIIQLGLTADTDRLPIPLSGATVMLFVDSGKSYLYVEDSSDPGTYVLADAIGIAQKTYSIKITTPDDKVYESVPERMPVASGQLTTSYEVKKEDYTDLEGIITQQDFLKLSVNSILPETSETNYFKWNVEETFLLSPTDFPDLAGFVPPPCFIVQNADPQRVVLFNGEDLKTTSVEKLLVASRIIDWSFLEKHALTTYQTSMTKEAFEYWRKVNVLVNQVGSIFDTPPATITGNIRNVNDPDERVFGYFQASNQVFDRFIVYPDNLPSPPLATNCAYDANRFNYPSRCLDCSTSPNSSYNRPDWF
jgi:hypothetical protein